VRVRDAGRAKGELWVWILGCHVDRGKRREEQRNTAGGDGEAEQVR